MTQAVALHETDHTRSPRTAATRPVYGRGSTETQRISRSAALALYERELAYYRAGEQYLTIEKCAERCFKLSLLLAHAQVA